VDGFFACTDDIDLYDCVNPVIILYVFMLMTCSTSYCLVTASGINGMYICIRSQDPYCPPTRNSICVKCHSIVTIANRYTAMIGVDTSQNSTIHIPYWRNCFDVFDVVCVEMDGTLGHFD